MQLKLHLHARYLIFFLLILRIVQYLKRALMEQSSQIQLCEIQIELFASCFQKRVGLLSFPDEENARTPPRWCFAGKFTIVFKNGLDWVSVNLDLAMIARSILFCLANKLIS